LISITVLPNARDAVPSLECMSETNNQGVVPGFKAFKNAPDYESAASVARL
jgi:hypothetical protein